MTIRKAVLLLAWLFSVALSANAAAQSGDGSLRGIVNDEQGAPIPGVTVTATSPQTMSVIRSVNGVVKAQASGAAIALATPAIVAL